MDLVDSDDRVVGKATLRECLESGLLHRAVAVLVLRRGGRFLLQRRSLDDLWHPGRWTLSCTGHVRSGESYLSGARRELHEELGLTSAMRPVSKFLLPKIRSRGLVEQEVVALFTASTDAPVAIDPEEVHSVKEVAVSDVRRMMKGRSLTPDAKLLLTLYLGSSLGRPSSRHRLRALQLPYREKR